jgi:hypothetical protein
MLECFVMGSRFVCSLFTAVFFLIGGQHGHAQGIFTYKTWTPDKLTPWEQGEGLRNRSDCSNCTAINLGQFAWFNRVIDSQNGKIFAAPTLIQSFVRSQSYSGCVAGPLCTSDRSYKQQGASGTLFSGYSAVIPAGARLDIKTTITSYDNFHGEYSNCIIPFPINDDVWAKGFERVDKIGYILNNARVDTGIVLTNSLQLSGFTTDFSCLGVNSGSISTVDRGRSTYASWLSLEAKPGGVVRTSKNPGTSPTGNCQAAGHQVNLSFLTEEKQMSCLALSAGNSSIHANIRYRTQVQPARQ